MATYRRHRPIELLTGDEVAQLLEAAQPSNEAPRLNTARNRAMVAVLYKSGLRLSELLALTPDDVTTDLDGVTWLNVRRGKGGKQRRTRLFNGAVLELQAWLEVRAERVTDPTAPIFCTTARGSAGKPLVQPYVATLLQRLARAAGITKRVHPHGFRHSHASELFHRGVPVAVIQAQLGHSDPMTTFNYLQSIGCSDAHRALAAVDL